MLRQADASWTDPLARLPQAPDALRLPQTTPRSRRPGSVSWTRDEDGSLRFRTTLPHRLGAVGSTRHGLFANGAWYPQDPALLNQRWEVRVHLPPGTTGALGDVIGQDVVDWVGEGERVSLAVVEGGVTTAVRDATLLTRGPPRRALTRHLEGITPPEAELVIVEAPLRRRLARRGEGQLLVSDRAWRAFGPLQRYHDAPIRDALLAVADVPAAQDPPASASAEDILRPLRWLPSVDAILHDHNLPFYGDIFGEGDADDPVQDDLSEVYHPREPAPAVTPARPPLSLLATGVVQTVQLNQGWAVASGMLILRRGPSAKRMAWGALSTDDLDLLGATLGVGLRAGAPVDGQRRRHQLLLWTHPALLSPRTRQEDARWALGAGASWSYRSDLEGLFPVKGARARVAVNTGWLPEVHDGWRSASAQVGSTLSPSPRLALAWRLTGGTARSATPARLIDMGGPSMLRSVAPGAAAAQLGLAGATELRAVLARDLSVPLGFGWLSELQLTAGAERGLALVDGARVDLSGLTVGAAGVADVLGVDPRMAGLTAAWPVPAAGQTWQRWPTVYLRWSQEL